MNMGSQPEAPRDIPEADALEQQTPVLQGGTEGFAPGPLPEDASEPDVLEQRTDALPGGSGYGRATDTAGVEATEADLLEQAAEPPIDDEEDYPDAHEAPL